MNSRARFIRMNLLVLAFVLFAAWAIGTALIACFYTIMDNL